MWNVNVVSCAELFGLPLYMCLETPNVRLHVEILLCNVWTCTLNSFLSHIDLLP